MYLFAVYRRWINIICGLKYCSLCVLDVSYIEGLIESANLSKLPDGLRKLRIEPLLDIL